MKVSVLTRGGLFICPYATICGDTDGGGQKSAEVIVLRFFFEEGPNVKKSDEGQD